MVFLPYLQKMVRMDYKEMTNNPKVSVCIPTYNRANYVGETIQSVLAQTMKDFEIVIVDDGSTDNTQQVIKNFNDPRIKVHKNEKNQGMVPAWNKAVSLSKGKYITILHSDDRYLPGFLEEESKILDKNPDVGFVFSACRIIDDNGNLRWTHKWRKFRNFGLFKIAKDRKTQILDGRELIKELIFDNFIRFPTVMIRRECYDKVGMYTNKFRFGMDWYMWMQIALYYKAAYSDKALAEYRKHEGTDTAFLVNKGENVIDDYKVVTAMLDKTSGKNVFSKKEQRKISKFIKRKVLRDRFERTWTRIKGGNLKEARADWRTFNEQKKDLGIKYYISDYLSSLLPQRSF